MNHLLKVTEVGKRLNMSRSAVYSLMDRGMLSYCKIGKARRVPEAAVEKLVRESTVGAV